MRDLKYYINKRKASDKKFSKDFDEGYADLKPGVTLRDLREKAGLIQE